MNDADCERCQDTGTIHWHSKEFGDCDDRCPDCWACGKCGLRRVTGREILCPDCEADHKADEADYNEGVL
jgi:hypothetical protein